MGAGERIVLASASPRRRRLLREAGVELEVRPVEVDEDLSRFAGAEDAAVGLALRKARAALARLPDADRWVVAADTVVALGVPGRERLLGKPGSEEEAREMLGELSASRHSVVTGVAVGRCRDGALRPGFERTWVTMREITPGEVEAYAASGEWRGKAGGYAIQETADAFVTALEGGGFDNVVGLPVELTLALLARAGWPGAGRGHPPGPAPGPGAL